MVHSIQDRRVAMIDRLHDYVRRRLLPRLHASGEFELTPATKGRRSIVVFLECSAGRFVLKCHPEFVRAFRTYFAQRHIEKLGGPIPRLLVADFSPLTYLELGAFVLVEEAFEGKHLAELTDRSAAIADAARSLAGFHDLRDTGFGALMPFLRRRRGYFEAIMRRIERRIVHLGGVDRHFRPLLAPAFIEWFERFRDRVEDGSPYELSHLRMTGTNVLIGEEGTARIIDIVTSRYARAAFDLTSALHRWCHNEAQRDVLLASYFATRKTMTRERFERDYAFYHVYFHFSQAHDHGEVIQSLDQRRKLTGKRNWPKRRARVAFVRYHLREAWQAIRDSGVPMSDHVMRALRSTFMKQKRKLLPAPARAEGNVVAG
jgi:hypothetical protein